MNAPQRKKIAIDIDDVTASLTESVRVWANEKTGSNLLPEDYYFDGEYWSYYETLWRKHGLLDKVDLLEIFDELIHSDDGIAAMQDGRRVITALASQHDVLFLTARRPHQKDATRKWLDTYISKEIPLYLSSNPNESDPVQSKGEICAELGVDILIDDSVSHCEDAIQHGVKAVLFGDYGWSMRAPAHIHRASSWQDVEKRLHEWL